VMNRYSSTGNNDTLKRNEFYCMNDGLSKNIVVYKCNRCGYRLQLKGVASKTTTIKEMILAAQEEEETKTQKQDDGNVQKQFVSFDFKKNKVGQTMGRGGGTGGGDVQLLVDPSSAAVVRMKMGNSNTDDDQIRERSSGSSSSSKKRKRKNDGKTSSNSGSKTNKLMDFLSSLND